MHLDDAYKCMVIVGVVRCLIWNRALRMQRWALFRSTWLHTFSWRIEMHGDVLGEFLNKLASIPECAFVYS